MASRRPWTEHPKVVELRRRSRVADAIVGAIVGFREHQTGRSAALVAHFGFISLFPLFLVFTTILGYVLQGNEQLQQDIVDSVLAHLPLIGAKLAQSPQALQGSAIALVVGLLLALWSGLKAFVALQGGLDNTYEIAVDDRQGFAGTRVRALAAIAVIGLAQAASAFLTTVVTAAGLSAISNIGIVLAAAVLNAGVLSFTYRWLTSAELRWRHVLPGAVFAGVLFSLLQLIGTSVIARSQANAENIYGEFATVIALLAWLSLHATIALMGAELNRAVATSTWWPSDAEPRVQTDPTS